MKHTVADLSSSRVVAGNTTETAPANRVYFPALDGLRAAAFLAVFFHHYSHLLFGWVGVDCFFVLSGFLITGILIDTIDSPVRLPSFYARRTLRIFPLYFGVIFLVLLADPVMHWHWDSRWLLWPAYLGNWLVLLHRGSFDIATRNAIDAVLNSQHGLTLHFGHFWSLCVEEQFYLVWPFVVFSVRNRRVLLWCCLITVILGPMLRLGAILALPTEQIMYGAVEHNTLFRIDTLMVGAGLALLWRGEHRARILSGARLLGWLAAAIAGLFFLHPPHRLLRAPYSLAVDVVGFTLVALLAAIVIVRTLDPGSLYSKTFSVAPLRWMGRISYGAYVFHDIPHTFYGRLCHGNNNITAAFALGCTLLFANLSYRYVESPFLRLKTRFPPYLRK